MGREGRCQHISPKWDFPLTLTSRRNSEACLHLVDTKGQAN